MVLAWTRRGLFVLPRGKGRRGPIDPGGVGQAILIQVEGLSAKMSGEEDEGGARELPEVAVGGEKVIDVR